MVIPTDKDGVASLVLTDKEGEVNVSRVDGYGSHVVINPVVKYDDDLEINAPYVLCQPMHSRLLVVGHQAHLDKASGWAGHCYAKCLREGHSLTDAWRGNYFC